MRYINPWHNLRKSEYGPAFYQTDNKPIQYKGYLIINRIPNCVWDIVKDGKCITQRAGINGAKHIIDTLTLSNEIL